MLRGYEGWADEWSKKIAKAEEAQKDEIILQAALALDVMMQQIATEHLQEAYLLGLGQDELSADGLIDVQSYIDRNQKFLEFSFAPDVIERLRSLEPEQRTDAGAIFDSLGVYRGRVAMYAGPYWVLIWRGLGERVRNIERESAAAGKLIKMKVERILDAKAKSCATCPPKAGIYNSWEEMLQFCGGLPADGSDECGCNCRCGLAIIYV